MIFSFFVKKKKKKFLLKLFFLFSSRPTFPSSSQANLYRFNFCQIRTKSPLGLAFTMVLYLSPRQVWPTQGNFASRKKLEQHSYHESEVWYYLQVSLVYVTHCLKILGGKVYCRLVTSYMLWGDHVVFSYSQLGKNPKKI